MQLQEQTVGRWDELTPLKPEGEYLKQAEVHDTALLTDEAREIENARERFLAADGQRPTKLEQEAIRGTNDLLDVNFLDRCTLVCKAIGRVDARLSADGRRIRATGFLIAPGLLMTNHHVLPDADTAASGSVEFGYRYDVAGELGQTTRFEFVPNEFYVADEPLDYAVVAVKPTSTSGRGSIADFGYLRLHAESGKVKEREFVTIIQHPDGQPLQIALRENQVSRIDPNQPFIQYEADTAHGSSGAPVFNDSLQIAALHSGGRIKRTPAGEYVLRNGTTTNSLAGLTESDVQWDTNAGIRISSICPSLLQKTGIQFPATLASLQQAMAGGDLLARAVVAARTSTPSPAAGPSANENETMNNETRFETTTTYNKRNDTPTDQPGLAIPLVLRVSLEDARGSMVRDGGGAATRSPTGSTLEEEAWQMQVPIIYDGLNERKGYDPDFLELGNGTTIPLPLLTTKGKNVAARLIDDNDFVLRYHKFSVVMHKERRIALFTASNVDWNTARRQINGQKPSRSELSGIPDNVLEQWITDDRISASHQLPDRFFTEDRQAFDKGHLVRRDDVCWGPTFEDIQMGNGDTYHVTNCSPQISKFNQATKGDFNWGDFENEVQKKTKSEKVCIFAGPVLGRQDRWFRGVDDNGSVRVQIPNRYWKIVVAPGDDGPEAFGFMFRQNVTALTEKEFAVAPEWEHAWVAIDDIERLLRGWVDLSDLKQIDKFET